MGFLNKRIRNAIDTKSFSDLLRYKNLVIPDQTNTGTVTVTAGSNYVTGSGTTWPTNDRVNTSLTKPVLNINAGVVEIFPASMLNINRGDYVVIGIENPAVTETVAVLEIQTDRFLAACMFQHALGETVIASSLANQQFLAPYPIYTVKSVRSSTSIELDGYFGGPTQSNLGYRIFQGFLRISPNVRRLLRALDPVQGQAIAVDLSMEYIMLGDPQYSSTGDPQALCQMQPDPGGNMQWAVWPPQLSARTLSVLYYDGWPPLRQPNDFLPSFINPEVFIAGAIGDALRTRVIATGNKQDPFYDPQMAMEYEREYQNLLEMAAQADEGRYLKQIQNYQEMIPVSTNYIRSHVGWPTDWN
jgi:hypothetical protein